MLCNFRGFKRLLWLPAVAGSGLITSGEPWRVLGSHGETVGRVGTLRQTAKPEEGHRGVLGTGAVRTNMGGVCV